MNKIQRTQLKNNKFLDRQVKISILSMTADKGIQRTIVNRTFLEIKF